MTDVKHEIQNMVLTVNYRDTEFDLERLAGSLKGARYDPEVFPGIAYRMAEPQASFLIFASGKMNCVGARKLEDARKAIDKLTAKIRETGAEIESEPQIEVQNIVASFDFGRKFDLEKIARNHRNTEYEPEVFPGLVFRMEEPKAVILLFVSGKGVGAGFEKQESVMRAARKIVENTEHETL
ncbi:hypothetical protein AKJ66_02585 [candidate division MSBL1 archaeon SCGC-AAA259E22]|uniref:TATA-box-binding protein n=1 Tax=candidate division MSBL1 archaeon SCGC-AAA259E22 TaxID=1698265 RepID=A0A133UG34_9EURY|nr:hypothetical protein AKJ66_02585 [candidate division MSBL1 archaeon SCGC-AAA259E22]